MVMFIGEPIGWRLRKENRSPSVAPPRDRPMTDAVSPDCRVWIVDG
jgi:hypothetical protein